MYAEAQSLEYANVRWDSISGVRRVRQEFWEALVYASTPKIFVVYAEDLRENTPTFHPGAIVISNNAKLISNKIMIWVTW